MTTTNSSDVTVGSGDFTYRACADWARRPPGYNWSEVAGVATDSRGRVFVFNRGDHPMMVFDRDGTFLFSWGEDQFHRAHGVTIGPDDAVYCTDDFGHTVRKFTPEGRLLMTLGTGQPSDTGATSIDYRTIRHAGPPFHFPTNVALSAEGDLFIADGYGNARIHHFTPDGRLLHSWGTPGAGPGEFHIPHGIAIDRHGTIFVADRENSRIQLFTQKGEYLGERTAIPRPCQVAFDAAGNLYVAEVGYRAGLWPGTTAPYENAPGGRVSVFDPSGRLLARWGGGDDPTAAGDFFAPHDICIDSRGDVYVGEVVWSAGGSRGIVPPDCHALQKFERLSNARSL